MINDKDRDWGSDDRPWSAKHPTTSRILKGAAIVGGSLLALRFAGPQLLKATEGMLRRELSSAIGPGRRQGFLYNAFNKLGILERMPGISWDAAGRAIPRVTEYEELAEFSARYGGRATGSRLSSTHHAVINSHGIRHLFGDIMGQPIATDEMMRSLSSKQLGTLRSFVSDITNQTENLESGWHLNSKWRPLQELHRQFNPNGNFDTDMRNWKAKWNQEAEKAQSILSATSANQFDNFMHMAVGRIQGRKNLLGRILGVQEADTRDFPQLAQKEQEQLEKQLRDHHSSVTPGSEWDPNPIRAGSGIDAGHMPQSGGRIDPNIYKTKSGEIIDARVTGAVTGALWNEVKSGFQIPIIPYMKAYKPLRSGIIGDIGKSAKLTGRFNIGQVQPSASPDSNGLINPIIAVGDQLAELTPTYEPVHSTLTGMDIKQLEGNYERVPSGSAMAQRLADITGLTNKKDSWLASLPGPIGKVLGKVGDYLDLGMQATPSEFERQSSRISKFANPQYGGNLVRRIWSDPAEAEFSDAIAKKNALQSSFMQVGSLSKDSPIYKELHELAGRTVYDGGLDTVAQLENMHNHFSAVNYNEIRSNKLSYLLSQSFDDIRGARKLDNFREAIAEEMMLHNVVSKTNSQRDLMSLLSTGTIGNIGPTNSSLLTAYANDLPSNLGAKSWMTGSLLSNITDQNAELVLRQLRDKSSGSIVRKQVEEYVYNRAFPALSTWMPPEERTYDGTAFVAIKKGPNLLPDTKKPIMDSVYEMMTNWNEHLHQLGSSRNGEREITTATVGASSPFAKASQINNYLSHIGLGLSPDSLGSGVDALKNIALKRVLPIAAGTFYAGYASWEIRRLLYGKSADEEGNAPGPLTNLRAHLGIGWTWLKQVTGITNLQKEAIDFVPGLDNYLQPKTVKEYKEYLKNGYDQVRQGAVGLAGLARINFFNDTPVYGGKTMFWKPSWYATEASDAKFSETGETRDEFYSRAWLPTPRHLLSPLKRLTDPYWFERVHAEDRPYPVTGDMFAGSEKYFGPLGNLARPFETIANATIGRILKPKRVIDQVYDNLADINEKIAERESGGGYSGAPSFLHRILGNTATANWKTKSTAQNWLGGVLGGGSPYQGNYSSIGAGSTSSVSGWNGFTYGETPDDYNRDDVPQGGLLRSTPLGKNTLYQTTTNNLYERMASINKTIHGKANVQRLGALEAYRRPKGSEWWDTGDVEAGPNIGEQASAVLTSLANVGGLTGQVNRLVRTLTGEALFKGDSHAVDDPVARLESADLGYGGHRNKGIDYVNELKNRMPGWLPGEEGYVNYRVGDSYSKIRNGETRLPGAGYEKLHNVKVMQTRASSLGKSVDDIIGGMLNIEQPMSKYAEEAADAGTRIHRKIQRRWQSEGLAESVEEEMYNKRDGISGHLDAILKLPEGRTVVDIKTVNAKRYRQAQRKPFEEHLDQVNWYMHEKGISRGAIMYLNRDDPEETTVKYFGYSGRRYNSTMNKVASARKMIRNGMEDGSISRGDLYCISPDTLVEVGIHKLATVKDIVCGSTVLSHTGKAVTVTGVRTRTVEANEGVYKVKVATIPAFPFIATEEHPILTVTKPRSKKRGHYPSVLYYEVANAIIESCKAKEYTLTEIEKILGSKRDTTQKALKLIVKDGIATKSNKKYSIVNPCLYDIDKKRKDLVWKFTKDLSVGDYVAYPLTKHNTTDQTLDFSEYLNSAEYTILDDKIYYGQGTNQYAEITDYLKENGIPKFEFGERIRFLTEHNWDKNTYQHACYTIQTNADNCETRNNFFINRYLPLTEELSTLFGYYIAEGYIDKGKVLFAFHKKETSYVEEIGNYTRTELGIDVSVTAQENTNGIVASFSSKPFAELLNKLFGKGAKNKVLPEFIFNSPDRIKISLLRALFNGDGYVLNNGKRNKTGLATASVQLAYQVRSLLLTLGIVSSIVKHKPNTTIRKDGVHIKSGISYQVHINSESSLLFNDIVFDKGLKNLPSQNRSFTWFKDNDYLYLKVLEVTKLSEGEVPEVYGLEVGGENSFCVAGVATHNTSLDRFKILADVAPFAEQTKIVASQLSNKLDPDSKEWEEFQATKDRLQKQKQSYNLYPYRFGRESSIVQHRATIDKVIDANTFTIKEDPLHPIKFAGIRVSQKMVGETEVSRGLSGSLHNMAREARRQFMGYDNKGPIRFFGRLDYALDYGKTDRSTDARDKEGRRLLFDPLVKVGKILKAGINPGKRDLEWDEALARVGIKPGARVDLKSDPGYKTDSLNTERALVFAGGKNVNAELLDRNWAKKQRDKYSPVQNLLFYSPMERVLGRVGEAIAHADTPLNCIAPWTSIITDYGITTADKLAIGDKVLTSSGRFKPVEVVQEQREGKRIVDIKLCGSSEILTVTEDHPILALHSERKKRITSHGTGKKLDPWGVNPKPEFILAGSIKSYDYVAFVPEVMPEFSAPVLDLWSLNPERFGKDTCSVWVPFGKLGATNAKRKRYVTVTNDISRLLGYYAAEGCTSYGRGKLAYTIFTFHKDELDYISDVCRISSQFGKPRVITKDNTTHIYIGSCYLSELVNHYVGVGHNKRAPKELLTNSGLRAEFLRGLFRGDGAKSGYSRYDHIEITAINLLTWVRDALASLWKIPAIITSEELRGFQTHKPYSLHIGKWPLLSEFFDGYCAYKLQDAVRDGFALCNRTVLNDGSNTILYRVKSVVTSEYQGKTIDIQVADDDTFATFNASVHNTKFLRSRSPIEEYERGELYGKTGGSWSHPFRDKIVPAAHRMWHQNPLSAMLTGAAIAGAFWQTPGKQYETNILEGRFGIANDKVRLAIMGAGAAVGLIGSTIVNAVHGPSNPWIPERRRKEHDLQEYFDTLDYVKSKSLAKKYKELAYEKEGINVDEILYKTRMRAIGNKRDRQALEFEKAELRKSGRGRTDAKIKEINLALKNIAENETVQGLAPYAARAVAYEHAAEKTMYGLPSWSTVGDRLIAIPRKHRQLVTETMQHGTAAEKRRLVRELPNAEARVIGRQLDPEYQPEQRQNLVEYFQHHYLPRNQWAGYDEDQRLAMAQAKEIQRMGMDPNDAGPMYHNQFVAGLRHPLTVGPFDTANEPNARNVKDALYDLLGDHVDGLDINVHASNMRGRTKVHSDLGRDRSDDYTDYMNKHRQSF